MGLRATPQQISRGIQKALKGIRKDLESAGVRVQSGDSRNFSLKGDGWEITYRTIFASNGETASLPKIQIWPKGDGGPLQTFDHLNFWFGIEAIKKGNQNVQS